MNNLLEKAFSEHTLNKTWKVLKKDKTDWSRKVCRSELDKNLLFHMLTLRKHILEKTYQPEPLRSFKIKQGNGKIRSISTPYLRDKLAQKSILFTLEPIAERIFHHHSYGYRPQRSVMMAASKARELILLGKPWLVHVDIEGFFDNISHSRLKKTLHKIIPDKNIIQLIEIWINQYYFDRSSLGKSRGISQGSVISPLLCNLFLSTVDLNLEKKEISFVRYSDDILAMAADEKMANKTFNLIKSQLKKISLNINEDKTKILKTHKNHRFLGQRMPNFKEYHTS